MPGNNDIVLFCDNVGHSFGQNHVLHDVRLHIGRGQIIGLVGPSGCGKSTLLKTIVGTHPPARGHIYMNPPDSPGIVPVGGPGRDRGMVYQRYSVFPNMTALQNVAFGRLMDETSVLFRMLRPFATRRLHKAHLREAEEILVKVGLKNALNKYPHELSGGMQQRVAIAQALIMKPEILLMDEPFGALDEATREELQRMLLTLYAENVEAKSKGEPAPHTVIIVTHELNEALYVGDRVIGLSQYWNWEEAGFDACPGATVVYDNAAPIHHPEAARDFENFEGMREEIRNVVFEPKDVRARKEFVRFWEQVHAGDVGGIHKFAPKEEVAQ